jgi:regulatory protein
VRRLAARDRFSGDLRAWLLGKGVSEEAAERAIAHLERRRLLNDDRTAENLVERSAGKAAKGRERLRAELRRLGADEETIERALAARDEGAELDAAVRLLEAKGFGPDQRARAGRLLASRGFDEETVRAALDACLGPLDE